VPKHLSRMHVPRATTKMTRKVSNFDQTSTQNEQTFYEGAVPWVGALRAKTERDIQVI
jgi:hypothetical protein